MIIELFGISGVGKTTIAKEMISNASFIMLMGGDQFKQKDMCERLGILEDITLFDGMYEKNFFQGQKLLIVMPYSYGMNEGEDERLLWVNLTL